MTFFDFLQFLGGCILTAGYIPQILQILKTKDAKGLNRKTFVSLTVGISLMEIYAVNLVFSGGYMFFVTNTAAWLVNITMLVLVIRYGEKPEKKEHGMLQTAYRTVVLKKKDTTNK